MTSFLEEPPRWVHRSVRWHEGQTIPGEAPSWDQTMMQHSVGFAASPLGPALGWGTESDALPGLGVAVTPPSAAAPLQPCSGGMAWG